MHNQRFFSYLSLFTFMMIILVTGNNYLLMFVGWEGYHNGLKWLNFNNKNNNKTYKFNINLPIQKRYYSINVKYSKEYKDNYILTNIQKEALIGIILGDGFLERSKLTHNTRLRIEQYYPEKIEYLESLYELLKPLTAMEPAILTRHNKKRNTTTQSLYFRTLAMPCLNYYYDLFYVNKIKIIPNNLNELLTPRGLAYWIMDDGSKSFYNQTILHTRAFKKEQLVYIQEVLYNNFQLTSRLEEKTFNQWVIYIHKRKKVKLVDIVGPYIHKSMLYKI